MPFSKCPLCMKRYSETFLAFHASSCDPTKKRPRCDQATAQYVYRSELVKPGPPSEIGAPGFHIFPNVFSDIEADLVRSVHTAPPQWKDYRFRKVKNYGPPYNLREKRFIFGPLAPPQIPIPQFVHDLVLPRLRSLPRLSDFVPNQLSVAEYSASEGHILPHNDCENGKIKTAVVGVCLMSRCTMTLILRARYSGIGKDVKKDVILPSGAVYIMSGDALRVWEHAIFQRNIPATRYSLTFRDVSPATGSLSTQHIKNVAQSTTGREIPSKVQERLSEANDTTTSRTSAKLLQTNGNVKRRRLGEKRPI